MESPFPFDPENITERSIESLISLSRFQIDEIQAQTLVWNIDRSIVQWFISISQTLKSLNVNVQIVIYTWETSPSIRLNIQNFVHEVWKLYKAWRIFIRLYIALLCILLNFPGGKQFIDSPGSYERASLRSDSSINLLPISDIYM